MSCRPAPKLAGYAGLAALGLLAALALGRPELVVLAAPFALIAGIGLALARDPGVSLSFSLDRERLLEGEVAELIVRVASRRSVPRLELRLAIPHGLEIVEGGGSTSVRLAAGAERELRFRLRARRWGVHTVGRASLRADDALRLVRYEAVHDERLPIRVYPAAETVRGLLRPLETQVFAGNQVSRGKGEGIEFADLRPFVPGDRIRRINWRASARRNELWVDELHPERNADVVLLIDSFAEVRAAGTSTLDPAVRAAAALAARYLRSKDRVGLVSFGGLLNWLLPGTGESHLYRIVEALLESEIVLNYAWRDVDLIPRRTLPPQALVLCLTPLLDDRAPRALLDLRSRGFDLAVVEISPLHLFEPGRSESERLAYRIWRLRREAVRSMLLRAGVPVVVWDDKRSLEGVLEEVRSFRRYRQGVRV